MIMTPNTPEWDPHIKTYRNQENSMVDYKWHIKEKYDTQSKSDHRISAVINRSDLDVASDPTLFKSSVSSLATGEMNVSGVKSRTRKIRVSSMKLAERHKIPLDMAQKTIQASTQLTVRTAE